MQRLVYVVVQIWKKEIRSLHLNSAACKFTRIRRKKYTLNNQFHLSAFQLYSVVQAGNVKLCETPNKIIRAYLITLFILAGTIQPVCACLIILQNELFQAKR